LLVQLENLSKSESPLVTKWTLTRNLRSSSTSTNTQERWRLVEPGGYTVSLITYTVDKCRDTIGPIYIPIEVYESPLANFSLSDSVISVFNPEVEVLASPKRAIDCDLFVGNSAPEKGCSGLFLFEEPGVYRISQLVTNGNGCTDTLSKTVTVENEYAFFAPNSFTPNTDGRNEEFRPVVIGAKQYTLAIHDRWGHIIFTSNDPKIGWDGMNFEKQEIAPIGVYLFQARVMDYLDEFHFYSGEVNLFR
jgi:gliding motility-associated-like protein